MATTTTFLRPPFADGQNPSAAKRRVIGLGLAPDSDHFFFIYKLLFCILCCKYSILFFTLVVISHSLIIVGYYQALIIDGYYQALIIMNTIRL